MARVQSDSSSTTGPQKDASLRRQGAAGAPPDDASALARSRPPWSARWTHGPEATRLPVVHRNRKKGGMVLGYSAGADAGATITPRACNPPQRRRRSATRGVAAHPKCACGAHVVCVLWWCSRPGRAPRRTGHRSGGYLMYRRRTRRSTRALTKCCVARSGHSRRRNRPCSG